MSPEREALTKDRAEELLEIYTAAYMKESPDAVLYPPSDDPHSCGTILRANHIAGLRAVADAALRQLSASEEQMRVERDALNAECEAGCDGLQQAAYRNSVLLAERDALREDAERYRWLRGITSWPSGNDAARAMRFDEDGRADFLCLERLDAAIDAARKDRHERLIDIAGGMLKEFHEQGRHDEQRVMEAALAHLRGAGQPVAWIWQYRDGRQSLRWREDADPTSSDVPIATKPLYASPASAEQGQGAAAQDENKLPSHYQLGDSIRVRGVPSSGWPRWRTITGICFRQGKVSYEVGGVFYNSEDVVEPLKEAGA